MAGVADETRRCSADMTVQRMDNVLIVVDDLEAAKAFFAELGMELAGEATNEGPWVDQVVGLTGVRSDIAMMRTPDGHGGIELGKFHTPPAGRAEPGNAPADAPGLRRIMFAGDGVDDPVAPRRRPRGRTRSAYAGSCSRSTTSTTRLPVCAATVANSSARSRSTRTSTGSASSAALRGSSSDWPRSSADPPMSFAGWAGLDPP